MSTLTDSRIIVKRRLDAGPGPQAGAHMPSPSARTCEEGGGTTWPLFSTRILFPARRAQERRNVDDVKEAEEADRKTLLKIAKDHG